MNLKIVFYLPGHVKIGYKDELFSYAKCSKSGVHFTLTAQFNSDLRQDSV